MAFCFASFGYFKLYFLDFLRLLKLDFRELAGFDWVLLYYVRVWSIWNRAPNIVWDRFWWFILLIILRYTIIRSFFNDVIRIDVKDRIRNFLNFFRHFIYFVKINIIFIIKYLIIIIWIIWNNIIINILNKITNISNKYLTIQIKLQFQIYIFIIKYYKLRNYIIS